MGYIPKDAKWYLAEIVEEITVEDDPRNIVHRNLHLIRADSPEEAYRKAMELGAAGEASWENVDGKRVRFRFRGLCYLNVIHDELEHGAELSYREDIAVNESTIQEWIAPKEELGVFRPITRSTGPHFASRDVIEEMYEQFPHLRPNGDKSKPN
jgi:Domain of unknown function (DUF4288)